MKIFAIKDDDDISRKNLGYLIYFDKTKKFYVELPEDADPWETPLLLSSFVQKRIHTVSAYWSKLWVQQRIVPSDRQNLGQILKENGLDEYDEFSLLMLADGRCAQDSYYLSPILEDELPESFRERHHYKVDDVVPLQDQHLLVFFRDGSVKKCNINTLASSDDRFKPVLLNPSLFCKVSVQTGGYGICWGDHLTIPDYELYTSGNPIPLSLDDFRSFISNSVVNTTEAAEMLNCSRQNIDDLIRRKKLHPVKIDAKNKLFLKNEIQQRLWQ